MKIVTNKKKSKLIEDLAENLLSLYGGDKNEQESRREDTKHYRLRVASKAVEFLNKKKKLKENLNQYDKVKEVKLS